MVKINWETSLNKKSGCIGFGCVARDSMGSFLGAKCTYLQVVVDPKMAEVMSTLHAVTFGKEASFFDAFFEGDALQVVQEINAAPPHFNCIGHFVESIKQELEFFRSSCVVHYPRDSNVIAHSLDKEAASNCLDVVRLTRPTNPTRTQYENKDLS
jgi:hypothetical protein